MENKKKFMINNLKGNSIVFSREWVKENDPIVFTDNIRFELAEYYFNRSNLQVIFDKHIHKQYASEVRIGYGKIPLQQLELYYKEIKKSAKNINQK